MHHLYGNYRQRYIHYFHSNRIVLCVPQKCGKFSGSFTTCTGVDSTVAGVDVIERVAQVCVPGGLKIHIILGDFLGNGMDGLGVLAPFLCLCRIFRKRVRRRLGWVWLTFTCIHVFVCAAYGRNHLLYVYTYYYSIYVYI